MPKLKSRNAAKKRLRFTASGKVKIGKRGRRHHLHQKTEKRKRGLKQGAYLPDALAATAHRQLPYGSR